jgi:glycosyltransferase involved in cell wall biosynthesis
VSLRILMVSQFYPPVVGGAEHHVRNLSKALVGRGHLVSVATIQLADDEPSSSEDSGVQVHRLRTSVQRVDRAFTSELKSAPPLPDPEAVIALRRIVRAEQPNVIHAHDWLARSVLPRLAREPLPLIVTLHDYSLVCAQKRLVHRLAPCSGPGMFKCLACTSEHYGRFKGPSIALANWGARCSDRRSGVSMYLAVSRAVANGNQLERRRLPFRVIPNFVPDDLGTMPEGDDPVLAHLPERDFLLFVGDVARDKGVEVLLAAYRRLDDPPPLVLIGRRYLPLENLPRGVLVLGLVSTAGVMTAWRRSLLGVVPSIVPDSCPTVVMEAMAAGRPVIGTRNGGIADLIDDGHTGILVPHSDPVALAHALQRVLASPLLRQRMSDAARRKFVHFTARSVVPRIEQVYEEALRG